MTHKLVDMKQTKSQAKAGMEVPIKPDPYPYGLALRLENSELKKLGMTSLPEVGDKYSIVGEGKVTSVHESSSEHNKGDKSVTIQIQSMSLDSWLNGKK